MHTCNPDPCTLWLTDLGREWHIEVTSNFAVGSTQDDTRWIARGCSFLCSADGGVTEVPLLSAVDEVPVSPASDGDNGGGGGGTPRVLRSSLPVSKFETNVFYTDGN